MTIFAKRAGAFSVSGLLTKLTPDITPTNGWTLVWNEEAQSFVPAPPYPVQTVSTLSESENPITVDAGMQGRNLRFREFVGGSGISLNQSNSSITISSTESMTNIGFGSGIYAQKINSEYQLKSILPGNNISISSDASSITVNTTAEINTVSTVGNGASLFAQKVGVDLRFKSLVAGSNISISNSDNEVTITSLPPSLETFEMLNDQTDQETNITSPVNTISIINYGIVRDSAQRVGTLYIANNTLNDVGFGDVGITFSSSVVNDNVVVTYSTTDTGFNANIKYQKQNIPF